MSFWKTAAVTVPEKRNQGNRSDSVITMTPEALFHSQAPMVIPSIPVWSTQGIPLYLIAPPVIKENEVVFEKNLYTQKGVEKSDEVLVERSTPFRIMASLQKPEHKTLSNAMYIGWEDNKVTYIVQVFGRKNGMSNLCGDGYTCAEILFQAAKAYEADNIPQMLKILEAKTGDDARKMAGAKELPMSEEHLERWNGKSLEMLLRAKLVSLNDPIFLAYMRDMVKFCKENNNPPILFLEIGGDNEPYTCGMMGPEIEHVLKTKEDFDALYSKFGPEQQNVNKSGWVVNKVFEIVKDAGDFDAWDAIAGWDSMLKVYIPEEAAGEKRSSPVEVEEGACKLARITSAM